MQILIVNNDGGGFAERRDVPDGTTAMDLFRAVIGEYADADADADPDDYKIRVNREVVTAEQPLRDGDRLTITPVKIDGAA